MVLATVKFRIQKQDNAEGSFHCTSGWFTPFIGSTAVLWLFSSQENIVIPVYHRICVIMLVLFWNETV
ncbi:MAG: hypothetical protein R2765_10725 [Ferruginibacter sp.]